MDNLIEAVEDANDAKAALKWAVQMLPALCPLVAGSLKIYCAETKCTPDCPIYCKESGYLAYSIGQM